MNEKAPNAASEYILPKKRSVVTKTVSTMYPGGFFTYRGFPVFGSLYMDGLGNSENLIISYDCYCTERNRF